LSTVAQRAAGPPDEPAALGVGRFGGRWALEEFTTDHWISVRHQPRRYPI
jgi:hypothetical protein